MARKIFKRVGVRRDRNLSDLSSTKEGLNNLLDTLIDEAGTTFVSEDLDPIRNIYAEGLNATQYQKVAGSRTQYTQSNGSNADFKPAITYQNQLDRFENFSGTPRINGRNGLTARYYNNDDIDISQVGIFTGTAFQQDNFWEAGNFTWTGKITPMSDNSNGGIEWEGYFIPTITSKATFYYDTTASYTFEFQTEGADTYTEHMRVGTVPVSVGGNISFGGTFTTSASAAGNEITLTTATKRVNVAIGQTVTGPGNIVAGSKVYSVSETNGTVTLVHPDVTEPDGGTPAVTGSYSNTSTTFFSDTGVSTRKAYSTYVMEEYQKYKIRIRYFIPRWRPTSSTWQEIDSDSQERTANFDISRNLGATSDHLRYNELFSHDYDFSDDSKGKFPIFIDNSILFGGTTTSALGSSTNSGEYVKVKSSKKIDIKYIPPTSLSAITKASHNGTTVSGTPVIVVGSTTGIEVGNYVFGTGIPDGARIRKIVINQYVLIDTNTTSTGTNTHTYIDHRGFVKKVTGSTSGTTLTISSGNTTGLKSGMIMICSGSTKYTGITTTGSTTQATMSESQGHGNRALYFYEGKGLRNDSLLQFCQPTIARCLSLVGNVASGSNVLTVSSIPPEASTGWEIRGFQFDSGTTITIDSATQITLSKATINDLLSGESMSIAPAANGDRTLCCPPVDTSPPFTPTEEGLETSTNFPNLKINGGNVRFDEINVTSTGINIVNYTDGDTSNRYIPINTPSGNFKLLATT